MGEAKKGKERRNPGSSVKKGPLLPLPVTREECRDRGWDEVDVVLVTGDAYVDHPSFGVALIGRLLESHGLRVAILAQPRHHGPEDFRRFGRPRLFFGITAGNLDSICSNYTGNARVRKRDVYSPNGDPYFSRGSGNRQERRRPDRATIRYAQLARAAYRATTIVLGGIEASLRRFVHYDYKAESFRSSVLTDSKADILVYGMGERAVLEIASRLSQGKGLSSIPGTCVPVGRGRIQELLESESPLILPSFERIVSDERAYFYAEKLVERSSRMGLKGQIAQEQKGGVWVLQEPPQPPLNSSELDRLYELPFTRRVHPLFGPVPAHRMIRTSVTIVRGCPGNCSFCAISRHQGPVVTWRSPDSVMREVERITKDEGFDGVITDLGGPTANLYGAKCSLSGACKRHDCLYPSPCKHLSIDEDLFLALLKGVKRVKGVRHCFVSSGLRMELLLRTPRLLERLVRVHMPGRIKIAPEHTEDEVLRLMHKPGYGLLEDFLSFTRGLFKGTGVRPRFSAYLISSHPGCTVDHMKRACRTLKTLGLSRVEVQDFTPTPGTLSTAMYVSGLDRDNERPIHVPRGRKERRLQRRIIEECLMHGKKR